jgi:hypothetical protein
MQVHVKKKQYRDHVREMTLASMVNLPDGNWGSPASCSPTVFRNVYFGTLGKAGRRRGGRAGKVAAEE